MRLPMLALALVATLAGCSGKSTAEQKQQNATAEQKIRAEETARTIREELGDEIEAHISYQVQGFGDFPSLYHDYVGYQFSGLKIFVNRKTGIVTIVFDCEFSKQVVVPAIPMLVRLFDQNGQYITHFVTEERYAAPVQFSGFSQQEIRIAHIQQLKRKHNYLQYLINLRDAAYVQQSEFGVFINK